MLSILSLRNWLIVSVLWAAIVGFLCWETWPRLSLDSGNDPGTLAAHSTAVEFHVFQYSVLGILFPVALFIAGWLLALVLKWRA
jgi:hypothetical protein